jgi:hypothetical protein
MRLSVTRTAKICPIEIAANISACVSSKIAQLHVRPYGLDEILACADVYLCRLDPANGWKVQASRSGLYDDALVIYVLVSGFL